MNSISKPSALFYYDCPPGLMAVSIFYWSWHTGVWPIGLLMGLMLEVPRWFPFRLSINNDQFVRLSNITSIILLLAAMVFFTAKLEQSIFLLVEWLPLLIFMMLLAQLYSEQGLLPLHAVVASLRKKSAQGLFPSHIDLRFPYILVTLLAASMAAPRQYWFYLFMGLMIFWALWRVRPKRYSVLLWSFMGLVGLSLGFIGHVALQQLQGLVQDAGMEWFQDWSHQDPTRKSTAIGQIGRLKLSNKIVLRIKSSHRKNQLLQQAIYNRYYGGSWHASEHLFRPVVKDADKQHWVLMPRSEPDQDWLRISAYLKNGHGFLVLPQGRSILQNRRGGKLTQNDFGSVQINKASDLLDYKVFFNETKASRSAPVSLDLELPKAYAEVTAEVVNELKLKQVTPTQAVQSLENFFNVHFRYSLIQDEADVLFRPMDYFLRISRKGHCEYFATAGALILRAAGIPTRYVSGYLMSEYQESSERYVVRTRHAHAWTQAYINGQWENLDFTPATWAAMEEEAAPWWEAAYDVVSHVVYLLLDWWWEKPRSLSDYIAGILLVLLLFYVVNKAAKYKGLLRWKTLIATARQEKKVSASDSPFYRIIIYLEQELTPRNAGETTQQWLQRLFYDSGSVTLHGVDIGAESITELEELLRRHYQFRFDNSNLDRDEFKKSVDLWMRALYTG